MKKAEENDRNALWEKERKSLMGNAEAVARWYHRECSWEVTLSHHKTSVSISQRTP